jgi:hypothetical protein
LTQAATQTKANKMSRKNADYYDRLEAQHEAQDKRRATLRRIAEDKYFDKWQREAKLREEKCPALIGKLCSGRFYIIGRDGKARYFDTKTEAEDFLIRNEYV